MPPPPEANPTHHPLQSSSLSVIHVDPDAHYRNLSILNSLLPKESSSKVRAALHSELACIRVHSSLPFSLSPFLPFSLASFLPPFLPFSLQDTDAALLCVLGFPAFAIDNKQLAQKSYDKVLNTLEVCPSCYHTLHTGHGCVSAPLVYLTLAVASHRVPCATLCVGCSGDLWANEIHK